MRDARDALRSAAHQLDAISLAEVLAVAELQSRVDRKYLVTPEQFHLLVRELRCDLRVLEIDGLRDFRYESVYFDTAGLAAYRHSATGRRSKFKVRTRTYLDSGECMLEVKTEGGRGETVKARMPYAIADRERLTVQAHDFVAQHLDGFADPADLSRVLRTCYSRMTLVDGAAGSRVTCDARLVCTTPDGAESVMDRYVLVEVKSLGGATTVDRALWSIGERPVAISKYCVGLALVHPDLPANRWNRTLRRYFDWEPVRASVCA